VAGNGAVRKPSFITAEPPLISGTRSPDQAYPRIVNMGIKLAGSAAITGR
jgi:hypothetical protein